MPFKFNPFTNKLDLVDTVVPPAGGDVNGPGSSTNNAIVRWDLTSGTEIKNSTAILDDNGNIYTNLFSAGYTETVLSASPVLTVASTQFQYFTGGNLYTLTLPVTSTLVQGLTYYVVNTGATGDVTVKSSGGNNIYIVPPRTIASFTVILTSGTSAASWSYTARPLVLTTPVVPTNPYSYAISDETTSLTTGIKITFRCPINANFILVRACLTTASSSGDVSIDMLVNSVSALSTKITIPSGQTTSVAGTPPVISTTSLVAEDVIQFEILSAGTTATGAKVTIYLQEI